jgi:hypothetical protein
MPIRYATERYMDVESPDTIDKVKAKIHIQQVLMGTYMYMLLQETSGVAHDLVPGYACKAKQWLVHGGRVP